MSRRPILLVVGAVVLLAAAVPLAAAVLPAGSALARPAPGAAVLGGGLLSSPGDGGVAQWEARGRPFRLAVVRPGRLETVEAGRPVGAVDLAAGPMTLDRLAAALPSGWVTRTGDGARVATALSIQRGAELDLSGVRLVELASGTDGTRSASVHTAGGGRTLVRGVAVSGVDRATGRPAPASTGSPAFSVSAGGTLDVSDATLTGLGHPAPTAADAGDAALSYGKGASGSVIHSRLERSGAGIALSGSDGVRLADVAVADSGADGVVLDGDRRTAVSDLHSDHNVGSGIVVTSGDPDRVLTRLGASDNRDYGLAVIAAVRPHVGPIATGGNGKGGVRLNRLVGGVVSDVDSSGEALGVIADFNTSGTLLTGLRAVGDRRAVTTQRSTVGLVVRDVDVRGADGVGVSLGGRRSTVTDVHAADSSAAVRVEHGAGPAALEGISVSGGLNGVVATAGATGVTVRGLVADGVSGSALHTDSAGTTVSDAHVTGGRTGFDLGAASTITDATVRGTTEGVHASGTAPIRLERLAVDAFDRGVVVEPGAPVVLAESRIDALESVRGDVSQVGTNTLSLPPIRLVSVVGGPLLCLAMLLEGIHIMVNRRRRRSGAGEETTPGTDIGTAPSDAGTPPAGLDAPSSTHAPV